MIGSLKLWSTPMGFGKECSEAEKYVNSISMAIQIIVGLIISSLTGNNVGKVMPAIKLTSESEMTNWQYLDETLTLKH